MTLGSANVGHVLLQPKSFIVLELRTAGSQYLRQFYKLKANSYQYGTLFSDYSMVHICQSGMHPRSVQ